MVEAKTIYFSACGIGLGHVGRDKPIVRQLHNNGTNLYFTGYGESLDQLKDDKFKVISGPEMKFYENPDGSFNGAKTSLLGLFLITRFLHQVKFELKLLKKYKPDIIVIDTKYSTLFAAKEYTLGGKISVPIIFITNQLSAIVPTPRQTKGFWPIERFFSYLNIEVIRIADQILIVDLPPPYSLSNSGYDIPDNIADRFGYVGPILYITPEELPPRKVLRKRFTDDDKPLIYAPVAGTIEGRIQLKKLIIDTLKDFDGKVIVSMGNYGKNNIEHHGSVEIHDWLDQRYELIKASDLVIARSGLGSVGDLLRFGIPSILIPTLNHPEQIQNAKSMAEIGCGKLLHQYNLNKEILLPMIYKTMEDQKMKRSLTKVQKLMKKYDGKKNIINKIKSTLK